MKNLCLLTLFFLMTVVHACAQPWVKMMDDPEVNFYEVQQAFENAWGDKGYERGKGYKQYKRWEYFTEPRVYPSGERAIADDFWQGVKQAKSVPKRQGKTNGDWEPVGPIQWQSQGWNPGLGRVNAVMADPADPSKIYVCTPAGGLWVRNGETWTCLTDKLASIGASGLAIDPTNTDILYLATGDGDGSDTYSIGVVKSMDGGATWQETGLTLGVAAGERMSRIIMHPTDPLQLWVAGSMGLYTTTNGGEDWNQILSGNYRDVEFKPGDPETIYAAGSDYYRYSTDGGETFQEAAGLPSTSETNRLAIAVTPANPTLVYVLAGKNSDSGFLGLYRSEDSGQTFELMSDSPNIFTYSEIGEGDGGQSWYDMALAASPTDGDYIVAGGINVWASTDGGSTWQIKSHWVYPSFTGYTHADIHSLDFFGDDLYCGSDGGVFHSGDNGNGWTDLSDGLQISQYYRIATSTTDPDRLLVGAQDNGTNLFGAGESYVHLLGGDGNAAAIDYSNDNIMYAAYPGGNFQRSTDGGENFSDFTASIFESGAWVTPFALHPTQPDIAYAAYENVWMYDQGSWAPLGSLPGGATLSAMEVAPADPSVIYVSAFDNLYKTVDGGEQWVSSADGLPNLSITDIETDPSDAQRVWVTFSGYSAQDKVYHSENGGDTWQNMTENLPNLPVNCISYLQGSDDALYIGTDNGVFYHNGAAPNWSSYNEGLPNVIVNHIVFQYASQKVVLATYGRGVWKNDFLDPSALNPEAQFIADKTLFCSGDSVHFSNFSVNSPSNPVWTFEGGDPETSTEYSPTVTYPNPGTYSVSLVAANSDLTDTLERVDYIQVLNQVGETAPFEEDFESPLNTLPWTASNDGGSSGWQLAETGYLSDGAIMVDNFDNPADQEEIIDSYTFDLSGLDTALVTLRVAYAPKPGMNPEFLKLYVSTDCGETWNFKSAFMSFTDLPSAGETSMPFVPSGPEDWNFLTMNNIEPEERTSNFRLRLLFQTGGGNNIYVDDINITDELIVGTEAAKAPRYHLETVPNPAAGQTALHFELPAAASGKITVWDTNGKIVLVAGQMRYPAGANAVSLDLDELKAGVYFVVLSTPEGQATSKLVVSGHKVDR